MQCLNFCPEDTPQKSIEHLATIAADPLLHMHQITFQSPEVGICKRHTIGKILKKSRKRQTSGIFSIPQIKDNSPPHSVSRRSGRERCRRLNQP